MNAEDVKYKVSPTSEIKCCVDEIRTKDGEMVITSKAKREGDNDYKYILVDWKPVQEDPDDLDAATGKMIFKQVNDQNHPLLFNLFENLLVDEKGIEYGHTDNLEGKKATLYLTTVELENPYYMMRTQVKDGKKIMTKALGFNGKPVVLNSFTIKRFKNETGSLTGDIAREIRTIIRDTEFGGGFVKTIKPVVNDDELSPNDDF